MSGKATPAQLLLGLAGFALSIGAALLGAFVLRDAWGWFVSPLGVPAITFWWAFALRMVVPLLVPHHTMTLLMIRQKLVPDSEERDIYDLLSAIGRVFALLFVWGVGFWLHSAGVAVSP